MNTMGISEFEQVLNVVETAAAERHVAKTAFQRGVNHLYKLYEAGKGNEEQRAVAIDHMEDAGLIPFRERDASGRIVR